MLSEVKEFSHEVERNYDNYREIKRVGFKRKTLTRKEKELLYLMKGGGNYDKRIKKNR